MTVSALTDLLDAQWEILKADLGVDVVPLVQKSNNLIAANPTLVNVAAQGQAILVDLIAEGPKVEQDEIKELATWVNTKLGELAAGAATTASPAATKTS